MKTLKIFISSTFKDMNAERDVLIKSVFPRLREKAEEELSVRVQEIDLRWGVTEEQVMRGDVVELCLDGIEECKPYFLCMIGKRYGWIPAPAHIRKSEFELITSPPGPLSRKKRGKSPAQLTEDERDYLRRAYGLGSLTDRVYRLVTGLSVNERQRVQVILEKAGLPDACMSITEQEINYVLSNMELPRSIIDLDKTLAVPPDGITLTQDEHTLLDSFYVRETGGQRTWWLQPGATDQEKTLLREILEKLGCLRKFHSFFFLRKDAGEDHEQYIETTELGHKRLVALRERVFKLKAESRIDGFVEYECSWNKEVAIADDPTKHPIQNLKEFEQAVFTALWEHIQANPELGEESKKVSERKRPDQETYEERQLRQLDEENEQHERFADSRTWNFYGREPILAKIQEKIRRALTESRETNSGFVMLSGEPGSGKSALMAKTWLSLVSKESAGANQPLVIGRFIGASSRSTTPANILTDIAYTLIKEFNITDPVIDENGQITGEKPAEIPADPIQLQNKLNVFFSKATRPVIFILDAVNQARGGAGSQELSWLPYQLPQSVCLVISLVDEKKEMAGSFAADADRSAIDAMRDRWQKPVEIPVPNLDSEEKSGIISSYLRKFNKQLSPDLLDALAAKQESGNPLYLQAALEELRILGKHELLHDFINKLLPQTMVDVFAFILVRVETDLVTRFGSSHTNLFRDFMVYLACGRNGMTEEDLRMLLGDWQKISKDATYEEKRKKMPELMLPEYLWGELRRSMRPYLFIDGEEWDFYHRQVKEAVGRKWLKIPDSRLRIHKTIADYLEMMGYDHLTTVKNLPHHILKSANDIVADPQKLLKLSALLSSYSFLQSKVNFELIYDLISDYSHLCNNKSLGIIKEALILSAHVLIKNTSQLPTQLRARLQDFEEIEIVQLLEDIVCEKKSPWLNPLNVCLPTPSEHLIRIIATGYNTQTFISGATAIDSMGKRAIAKMDNGKFAVFDLEKGIRQTILQGHNTDVNCLAISGDGKRAISGGLDHSIKIWDLQGGGVICTLNGHEGSILSVAITADGKTAISASTDKTLKTWDLCNRIELCTLSGHATAPFSAAISADGRIAMSLAPMTLGNRIIVWDSIQGEKLFELGGHQCGGFRCGIAISADSRIAASVIDNEGCLRIWDLQKREELCTLLPKNRLDKLHNIALNADGSIGLAASDTGKLFVWDITNRQNIEILDGHSTKWVSLSMTLNGRFAISAAADNTLKYWNLERKSNIKRKPNHQGEVISISNSIDGKTAATLSTTEAKYWNIDEKREIGNYFSYSGNICSTDIHLVNGSSIFVTISSLGTLIHDFFSEDNHFEYDKTFEYGIGITGRRFELSADNLLIAITGDNWNNVCVWNLEADKKVFDTNSGKILRRGLSPDNSLLLVPSNNNALRVYDIRNKREVFSLEENASGSVAITPDGRYVLFLTKRVCALYDLQSRKRKFLTVFDSPARSDQSIFSALSTISVSNDARWAVSTHNELLAIWNLSSGIMAASFCHESNLPSCAICGMRGSLIAGSSRGEVIFFKMEGIEFGPQIVTPVRKWQWNDWKEAKHPEFPDLEHKRIVGTWDDCLTIACAYCGNRSKVTSSFLDTISFINRESRIGPDDSPCLKLPPEAWDEPRLLSECPNCHGKIKFNPFVVDNRARWD